MLGLLVLLDGHKGSEDIARLADDLDLEIDEIFPSVEFAEILQFIQVKDGLATFTDLGRRLVGASIRERKSMIREQLKKTTLFRTLLRALEQAPDRRLSDEQLGQIVSLTSASAEEGIQNIVNWGRYADLFRYDADAHQLIAVRRSSSPRSGAGRPPPPAGPANEPPGVGPKTGTTPSTEPPASPVVAPALA